jgi:hypothetical protein
MKHDDDSTRVQRADREVAWPTVKLRDGEIEKYVSECLPTALVLPFRPGGFGNPFGS